MQTDLHIQKMMRRKEQVVRLKRAAKRNQSPDFYSLRKEEQMLKKKIKEAQDANRNV
jgi:hypothetical protein